MTQQVNNSQNTSQSHSAINNLSIFTKNSSHLHRSNSNLHRSNSNTSSDKMIPNPAVEQPLIVTPKPARYNPIQWLIVVCSIFAAALTIILTRRFYILEIIIQANFNQVQSILQPLKLYSLTLIFLLSLCSLFNLFSKNSPFLTQLNHYRQNSIRYLLLLVTLCFYLYFATKDTTKDATKNQHLVDKTFVKISHFITWYVFGSVSAFAGFLVGRIFSTHSFCLYGETIILLTFIILLSCILSFELELNTDIFDLIR